MRSQFIAMLPRVLMYLAVAAAHYPAQPCVSGELTVAELTNARIEYVKQQILKKLRLSRKPAVAVPVNSLPMPVAQGQTLSAGSERPPDIDDYYGRTEQKIIFPVESENISVYYYLKQK